MKIHCSSAAGTNRSLQNKSSASSPWRMPGWPPGRLLLLLAAWLAGSLPAAWAETLNIVSEPPNFTVTWSSSSYLERAFDPAGPWAAVPGAISPFTFAPTDSHQFFRLVSALPGSNQPPTTVNDFFSMAHDQLLFIPQLGVLYNDTVTNNATLTAVSFSPAQHGSVNLFLDGSFLYQPNPGFVGTDYFEYLAMDGLQPSAVATVTITVTDSPPVVVNDSFGIQANTTGGAAAPGVLRHATALAGTVLTATLASSPTQGSLALHSDGSFEYTPNPGFTGTDTFTYQANSATSASGAATISLVVHGNIPIPTAGNTNYAVGHDQNLSVDAPGLLSLASDANADPLTAAVATAPANGTLALMPDGSFLYQPAAGFTGTDSFTWQAQNSATNSALATVTIQVTNAVPVAVAETFYLMPGQTLTNPAPGVLQNDTDADGDSLTALLDSSPSFGILALHSDGSFTYQPTNGFIGTDSFSYAASDSLAISPSAVVTIIVSNRAPVALADSYGACQNQSITALPPGVLGNDTDPDGNPMTCAPFSLPTHGSLTLSTNGGFLYSPDPGYSGPDSFSYVARDAFGSSAPTVVSVVVTTNCLPPIAVTDSYITRPNEALSPDAATGLLVNDEDVNKLPLTAQLVTGVSHGVLSLNADGSFTYTPDVNFMGTDSFTYKAFNGSEFSQVIPVTINVTDGIPVSVGDSFDVHGTNLLTVYAPGVLENDYDSDDGDVLSAVLAGSPHHGTLSLDPSGEFTYTANNGFIGNDYFSYQATDGTVTGAVTIVNLKVGNQRPIVGDDEYDTAVNTLLSVPAASGVLVNDEDGDDDALTAAVASGPAHAASFSLNPDGSFNYTPAGGFSGTDTFTYTVNDGYTNSATGQVTITVNVSGGSAAFPAGPVQQAELDLTAVSFVGGSIVVSDTVRPFIGGPPQWLDSGDGIINPFLGERSYPYSYVRGNSLFARAVFRTPNRNAFRGPNGKYLAVSLRGRLFNNGVAIPGALVTPTRFFGLTPDRVGLGGTVYVNVRANTPFANAVGFLNLRIVWEYSLTGGATWTRCAPPGTPAIAAAGTSWHRIYVTLGAPQAWPLFETELAYGSITGAGQVNAGPLLTKIWSNFKNQNARRIDGTRMTYYHDWNVPTIGGVPDLLRLADGRCGQWALFFIGALQAQGMAPFTMRPTAVYTVPRFGFAQCRPVNLPFMVAKWNFGLPGVAGPNYANLVQGVDYTRRPFVDFAFPFENVFFLNPFDQFPPNCANVLPPFPPGHWGFPWQVPPEVDYVGGAGLNKGQNNPTPRPLFTDHAIVFYAGLFFDPSYGTIYLNNQDMQNQAISGICYATLEADWRLNPATGLPLRDINGFPVLLAAYPVLHVRQTPMWTPPLIYFCLP